MFDTILQCSYCKFELLLEDDAKIESGKVYIVSRQPQIWIHSIDSSARCVSCDTVIGHLLPNNPDYIMIWDVEIYNDDDGFEGNETKNNLETGLAKILFNRFSKVK